MIYAYNVRYMNKFLPVRPSTKIRLWSCNTFFIVRHLYQCKFRHHRSFTFITVPKTRTIARPGNLPKRGAFFRSQKRSGYPLPAESRPGAVDSGQRGLHPSHRGSFLSMFWRPPWFFPVCGSETMFFSKSKQRIISRDDFQRRLRNGWNILLLQQFYRAVSWLRKVFAQLWEGHRYNQSKFAHNLISMQFWRRRHKLFIVKMLTVKCRQLSARKRS